MERDPFGVLNLHHKKDFNSHAHVERDLDEIVGNFTKGHFNSHAHVERDAINYLITALTAISTHTLTWSVTVHMSPMT